MTPIPEEIGQTAREALSTLRSAPVVMTILLLNLFIVVLMAWAIHQGGQRWENALAKVLAVCVQH
jgi:hypothetical protein